MAARTPLGSSHASALHAPLRTGLPAGLSPYAVTRSLLFYLAHGPVKAARLAQTRSPFEGERRAQRTAPRTPWPDSRGAGPKGWTRTARRDAGVGRGTRKGGGGHARWGWALRPSIRGPAGRGGARRSSAATWVRGSARTRLGSRRGRLRSASGAAVSAAAVLARCWASLSRRQRGAAGGGCGIASPAGHAAGGRRGAVRALSAGTAAPSGTLRASGAPTRRQHSPRCARGPCGRQAGRPARPARPALSAAVGRTCGLWGKRCWGPCSHGAPKSGFRQKEPGVRLFKGSNWNKTLSCYLLWCISAVRWLRFSLHRPEHLRCAAAISARWHSFACITHSPPRQHRAAACTLTRHEPLAAAALSSQHIGLLVVGCTAQSAWELRAVALRWDPGQAAVWGENGELWCAGLGNNWYSVCRGGASRSQQVCFCCPWASSLDLVQNRKFCRYHGVRSRMRWYPRSLLLCFCNGEHLKNFLRLGRCVFWRG